MANVNYRRITNEVAQIHKNAAEYSNMFEIKIKDENIYQYEVMLHGPEDSLYAGYKFLLSVTLPPKYPFDPINVKFITPISHVNVNKNGNICLDILNNAWAPSQNILSVMISLRLLLSEPNPKDPYNSDLAEMFRRDPIQYVNAIKRHCNKHAIRI